MGVLVAIAIIVAVIALYFGVMHILDAKIAKSKRKSSEALRAFNQSQAEKRNRGYASTPDYGTPPVRVADKKKPSKLERDAAKRNRRESSSSSSSTPWYVFWDGSTGSDSSSSHSFFGGGSFGGDGGGGSFGGDSSSSSD